MFVGEGVTIIKSVKHQEILECSCLGTQTQPSWPGIAELFAAKLSDEFKTVPERRCPFINSNCRLRLQ